MNWCATPGERGAWIALSDFLFPPGYDTLPLLLLVGELHRLDIGANPPLFQKTIKPAGGRPGAASARAFLEDLTVTIVRQSTTGASSHPLSNRGAQALRPNRTRLQPKCPGIFFRENPSIQKVNLAD